MTRGGLLLSFIISVFGFTTSGSISLFIVSKNSNDSHYTTSMNPR
jgi:hypothetical protein